MSTTISPWTPDGGGPPAQQRSASNTAAPVLGAVVPRRPSAVRRLARAARLRTVPSRIRGWTAAAVVAVLVLFAVAGWAIENARSGLRTIGHGAGPQVVATGTLYFALSDMDAQVANVLLIGREAGLGQGRAKALQLYEQRRAEANQAVLQAADLAGSDPTGQRTVRDVLTKLGQYERLAGQAMLLDQQANHAAGPPPPQVITVYRQATDLMKLELLPKAYNLTLDSGSIVRRTYDDKHSSVEAGQIWVFVTGVVVLVLLLAVQIYLGRRFRRILNPALALATLVAFGLTAATVGLLAIENSHLRAAKEDGFDSTLRLSQARAISNSAYADQSRYLLDPGRADTYEQVYLDKSQSILYIQDAGSLEKYYNALGTTVRAYNGETAAVPFLGFYGEELTNPHTTAQQRQLFRNVLSTYQTLQQDDQRMRTLVNEGKNREALNVRMSTSLQDFQRYDAALVALSGAHAKTFNDAIRDGDNVLKGWNWVLPGAVLAIVVLVLIGVRPRLAEYR